MSHVCPLHSLLSMKGSDGSRRLSSTFFHHLQAEIKTLKQNKGEEMVRMQEQIGNLEHQLHRLASEKEALANTNKSLCDNIQMQHQNLQNAQGSLMQCQQEGQLVRNQLMD